MNYYFEKLDERTKQNMVAVGKLHAIIGNGTGGVIEAQ